MRRPLPPIAAEVRQLRALLPPEAINPSAGARELPIRVLCRFRGQSETEEFRGGQEAWVLACGHAVGDVTPTESTTRAVGALPEFAFDRVFGPEAQQNEVFEAVEPVIRDVLSGLSGCVMCYGQTSAGKTYTMEGSEVHGELSGLIPRALGTVYSSSSRATLAEESWTFHISMLEIYMERMRDLLVPDAGAELSIVEDKHQGVIVRGLQEISAPNLERALEIWLHGRQHRAVAATGMNDASSRSHCIFMLRGERSHNDSVASSSSSSKLCLVDLAGSECVKKTCLPGRQASSDILEEAKTINQSLSTLGLVINRLAECRRHGSGKTEVHVPYRSSKLTRVLQDSLGGGSNTALMINCSISSLQVAETLSTLRFGTRARSCVNVVHSGGSAEEPMLIKTLRAARRELQRLQAGGLPRGACRDLTYAECDGFTPFSGLSGHSLDQESVSSIDLNSPTRSLRRRRSSRCAPPWLELSLVREADGSEGGSEEARVDWRRTSIASSLHLSPTRSRRVSRMGGPPSPLDLTPRSAAARSRKVSLCGGALSPLELTPRSIAAASRRVSRAQPTAQHSHAALDGEHISPTGSGPSHTSVAAAAAQMLVQRRHHSLGPIVRPPKSCWEHPLTKLEKRTRLVAVLRKELEAREDEVDFFQGSAERLEEQCEALQAEAEWLKSERSVAGSGEGLSSMATEESATHVQDISACCAMLYVQGLIGRLQHSKEVELLRAQHSEMEKQISSSKSSQEDLKKATDHASDLQERLESADAVLADLRRGLEESHRGAARARQEKQDWQGQAEAAQAATGELRISLENALSSAAEARQAQEEQMSRAEALEKKLQDMQHSLEEERACNSERECSLNAAQQELLELRQKHGNGISQLEHERDALQSRVNSLEVQNQNLQTSVADSKTRLLESESISTQACSKQEELRSQVEGLEARMRDLQQSLEAEKARNQQDQCAVGTAEQKLEEVRQQLESRNAQFQQERDTNEHQLEAFEIERRALQDNLDTEKSKLFDAQQQATSLERALEESQQRLAAAESTSMQARREQQELQRKLADLEASTQDVQRSLEAEQSRAHTLEQRLMESQQQADSREIGAEDLRAKLKELSANYMHEQEELRMHAKTLEATLQDLQCRVEVEVSKKEDAEAKLLSADQKTEFSQVEINELRHRLEAALKCEAEARVKQDESIERATLLESQMVELQRNLDKEKVKQSESEQRTGSLERSLQESQQRLVEAESTGASASRAQHDLQNQITDLAAGAQAAQHSLEAEQSRAHTLEQRLMESQQQAASSDACAEDLRAKLQELSANHVQEKEELQAHASRLEAAQRDLQVRVEAEVAKKEAAEAKLLLADQDAQQDLQNRIADLEAGTQAMQHSLEAERSRAHALDKSLTEARQQTAASETCAEGLHTKLQELNADHMRQQEAAQTHAKTLEASLQDLQCRFEAEVSKNQSAEAELLAAGQAAAGSEAKVKELEQQLDDALKCPPPLEHKEEELVERAALLESQMLDLQQNLESEKANSKGINARFIEAQELVVSYESKLKVFEDQSAPKALDATVQDLQTLLEEERGKETVARAQLLAAEERAASFEVMVNDLDRNRQDLQRDLDTAKERQVTCQATSRRSWLRRFALILFSVLLQNALPVLWQALQPPDVSAQIELQMQHATVQHNDSLAEHEGCPDIHCEEDDQSLALELCAAERRTLELELAASRVHEVVTEKQQAPDRAHTPGNLPNQSKASGDSGTSKALTEVGKGQAPPATRSSKWLKNVVGTGLATVSLLVGYASKLG